MARSQEPRKHQVTDYVTSFGTIQGRETDPEGPWLLPADSARTIALLPLLDNSTPVSLTVPPREAVMLEFRGTVG